MFNSYVAYLAGPMHVTRILSILMLAIASLSTQAQVAARWGFAAGPAFGLTNSAQTLNASFFTATRTGFSAGTHVAVTAGERFFSRAGVNYNQLNLALRQNVNYNYKIDIRWNLRQIEVPVVAGFSGYLGSLRHREYLGVAYSIPIGSGQSLNLTGDSASVLSNSMVELQRSKGYLTGIAGVEFGTVFENDGALFFGLSARWNAATQHAIAFDSNRFDRQIAATNGNFVMLEITYYLPRFSYWMKRDFTY